MKHLGYAAAILAIAASGLALVVFGPFHDRQPVYETEHGAVVWLSERR